MQTPVQKNQELTVTIADLTYEGMGVAKIDGYPLFIEDALPGEEVRIHVLKVQKQYGFAKMVTLLKASPERVAPVDAALTQTGIAPLQHLAYSAQLKFKQRQIELLYHKAHLDDIPVLPTLGMADPTHYRNKAQIPVREINGVLETGFYKRRSHELVPLTDFYIQDPLIDQAVVVVRDLLRKYGVSGYDEARDHGLVRHIMVRRARATGEMMVVLITRNWAVPHLDEIVAGIQAALPQVVSVMQDLNAKRTNVIMGNEVKLLAGRDHIEDELLGHRFRISALSFYQVNPQQTAVLYQTAIDAAALTGDEVVIDAYSGIGTISIALAEHARRVEGVEIVPAAVADARLNASLNGLTNVQFTVGKAEEVMQTWQAQGMKADVLMVDPPRKGLAPEFLAAVGQLLPPKMVYISCNPATLARDLVELRSFGYTAHSTQPVDMFPQTTHIESVTVLTLGDQATE
ncbi:23S rRNA (uracil(1939)-C(5))-methyltransferase RlmD [Lacticaseibacillus mingshuiensis]|uniref:23S rRNA (Uracil(1939)-C(5))-methyltransferase RlmD n=1 Tax=Lacticaseibacillus mingshuiensis TaxID=2799574 RepID=A0ABW4CIU9_9LACO|nr:23S rRNA (uracil(1939)-C(5))-methyltransferase RlmD [Lacticaseibacillus mingshuiensis]